MDTQLIEKLLWDMFIFHIKIYLKLKIALAIPISNDVQYNSNNSAGKGLRTFTALKYYNTGFYL